MEDSDSDSAQFHRWVLCIEQTPAHAINHFQYCRWITALDKQDCKILVSTCSELGKQAWDKFNVTIGNYGKLVWSNFMKASQVHVFDFVFD